jgi:PAS domain S-box-containing protein
LALKGEIQNYTSVNIHKNGNVIETNIKLLPITFGKETIGVCCIVKDITEIKRQNKMEIHFNNAQKLVNIGSWDYDVIENEMFWSDKIYCILEIDKHNDFVPTPTYETVYNLVHPQDRLRFDRQFKEALREGKSYSIQYRIIRKDGTERIVNEQADVILDENGKASRLIGITHDITEQKLIEDKLIEREKQFKNIYNTLKAGIWSVDVRTNKTLFCSRGIEDICGFSAHDFEENHISWNELIFPDDLEKVTKCDEHLRSGKVQKTQYRTKHKNGQIKWVQDDTIPVFDAHGNLVRLDGIIIIDITEQKNQKKN